MIRSHSDDGASRQNQESLLSSAEIEALREDAVEDAARQAPTCLVRDALIVVRSRAIGHELARELGKLSCASTVVRDPFRALDELRKRPRDLVVSEVEMWVDDGALLFDRLRETRSETSLVFICDADAERVTRLRRFGAAAVLRRPIRLEAFREELVSLWTEADPQEAVPADVWREPWLRFFYETRREVRKALEGEEVIAVVIAGLLRVLGASVVVHARPGQQLAVRVHASPGCKEDRIERVLQRVRAALKDEDPRRIRDDARGSVVLPLADDQGWLAVEFSDLVPRAAREFVQELGILLREGRPHGD